MESNAHLVARTRHLRLYKLMYPANPWDMYVLEGDAPAEELAMIHAFYSRSSKRIEDRIREMAEREHRIAKPLLDRLSSDARNHLARLLGHENGDALRRLEPIAEGALTRALMCVETDLLEQMADENDHELADKMQRFYVGYGHNSIGDCANIVVFVEGVPLHLPMQIQHSQLYNGQEVSTRYNDMSKGRRWNPLGTDLGRQILDTWFDLYKRVETDMVAALSDAHPFVPPANGDEKTIGSAHDAHKRALKARAFDIARGFIPIGGSTSYSWSTNVRQAADHLRRQEQHPDPLVRAQAHDLKRLLRACHPRSFSHEGRPETDAWLREAMATFPHQVDGSDKTTVEVSWREKEGPRLERFLDLLRRRPPHALIPRELSDIAEITIRGTSDVAGLRDLHRHRKAKVLLPLIKNGADIHPWYLDALTPELRLHVDEALGRLRRLLASLEGDPYLRQTYAGLGTRVPHELTGDLGALIYIWELRSKADVHPIVRQVVHESIREALPHLRGIPFAVDHTPDRLSLARGTQTIIDRETGRAID